MGFVSGLLSFFLETKKINIQRKRREKGKRGRGEVWREGKKVIMESRGRGEKGNVW